MQTFIERITKIITANFPDGIRDDFIDSNKVFKTYFDNYNNEIISRNKIAEIIHANGIDFQNLYDGEKIFVAQ